MTAVPNYHKFNIFFKKKVLYFIFTEGRREKEKERKINVWLPLAHPLLGTWPTTQTWALTGNQTGDSLVHRSALNPLSRTSQGHKLSTLTLICESSGGQKSNMVAGQVPSGGSRGESVSLILSASSGACNTWLTSPHRLLSLSL